MSIWLRPKREGTVSLVVPCGNREAFVRQSLPTWLACDRVDEIVISSYGSLPRLDPVEWTGIDPRIVLVETRSRAWNLARCLNVGVRMARGTTILKVDSDIRLRADFLTRHPLADSVFWAGNWRVARVDNERHLNGTVVFSRAAFEQVGGYHEALWGYGGEDTDFYERLGQAGYARQNLDLDTLRHVAHDDALRCSEDPLLGIWINRAVARGYPWGPERRVEKYAHVDGIDRHVICRPRGKPSGPSARVRRRAEVQGLREYLALKQGREPEELPAMSRRMLWHLARTRPTGKPPASRPRLV